MKDVSQVKQIIGTQFWAGSQDDILAFLQVTPSIRSVICLRRDVPEWWFTLQQTQGQYPVFVHAPVPSIHEVGTEAALLTILDSVFPGIMLPVVFFCLKGRNRTGMLAAMIRFEVTFSISKAKMEYRFRAGTSFRHEESQLLTKMCEMRLHNPAARTSICNYL